MDLIGSIYLHDDQPLNSRIRFDSFGNHLTGHLIGKAIERFTLHLRLLSMPPAATSWIDTAISQRLRDLVLMVPNLELPGSFFTCSTLEKLAVRLDYWVTDEWDASWGDDVEINLRKLISVDTSANEIVSANAFRIIAGAPALEEVTLYDCGFESLHVPLAASPTLRTLEITGTTQSWDDILFVLDSYPLLENLSFGKIADITRMERSPPSCVVINLKTLKVKPYGGLSGPELGLMLFILSKCEGVEEREYQLRLL